MSKVQFGVWKKRKQNIHMLLRAVVMWMQRNGGTGRQQLCDPLILKLERPSNWIRIIFDCRRVVLPASDDSGDGQRLLEVQAKR